MGTLSVGRVASLIFIVSSMIFIVVSMIFIVSSMVEAYARGGEGTHQALSPLLMKVPVGC